MPNWTASRPCAGHRVRCCVSGFRRALALPVPPPPPLSLVVPATALLRVLPLTAAEETDGAAARRRGSESGESADPALPAWHPRATPSGAAGQRRALGPAGARAPAPTGAAPPAPPAPRAPPRPPATWAPGTVGGRVWGQERDGAGKGES